VFYFWIIEKMRTPLRAHKTRNMKYILFFLLLPLTAISQISFYGTVANGFSSFNNQIKGAMLSQSIGAGLKQTDSEQSAWFLQADIYTVGAVGENLLYRGIQSDVQLGWEGSVKNWFGSLAFSQALPVKSKTWKGVNDQRSIPHPAMRGGFNGIICIGYKFDTFSLSLQYSEGLMKTLPGKHGSALRLAVTKQLCI
jgi:hypothetical protein